MIMHIDSNISVLNTYTNTKEKISTWIKFFYFSIFWKTLLFVKENLHNISIVFLHWNT